MYASHIAIRSLGQAGDGGAARVLDACCAPGGKMMHLSELCAVNGIAVSAVGLDRSDDRLEQTRAIARRMGHSLRLEQGDARSDDWWDEKPFDYILLDAPCSGSGTMRRNPDIKVLLREEDLTKHQTLQLQLLTNLWRMVNARGSLLYCTCSIFQEENDDVISQFLAMNDPAPASAHVVPIELPSGHATEHGWQLLPTNPQTDGFYYSLLAKSPRSRIEVLKEAF